MAKVRHEPVRTCVACREEAGQRTLVRIVRGADGAAVVDLTWRAPGRGAYLHRTAVCVDIARKRRNLERSLRVPVSPEVWNQLSF